MLASTWAVRGAATCSPGMVRTVSQTCRFFGISRDVEPEQRDVVYCAVTTMALHVRPPLRR